MLNENVKSYQKQIQECLQKETNTMVLLPIQIHTDGSGHLAKNLLNGEGPQELFDFSDEFDFLSKAERWLENNCKPVTLEEIFELLSTLEKPGKLILHSPTKGEVTWHTKQAIKFSSFRELKNKIIQESYK